MQEALKPLDTEKLSQATGHDPESMMAESIGLIRAIEEADHHVRQTPQNVLGKS